MVEPGDKGCERLLTLRLYTSDGPISLISAYAPTLTSTPEAKDEFYSNLNVVIKNIPKNELLVLLGDFNARVGADHDSWLSCLCSFGVGNVNGNGQRLLEFCSYHGLCVTNTFQTKPQHQVSWRHPRSKHWHQLDMIIVRHTSLKQVPLTRTSHSADCDTDHSPVCCNICLTPKTLHRGNPQGKPRINTIKMQQEAKIEEFAKAFEEAISTKNPQSTALDTWFHLLSAFIHQH
ncbi:craniofacial development protein 2-like [Montipora foliosa]|uniref:craniofacial development protein 2-like n=1 Tax=Montipora foliosa TaxID=591990 RepID=UPI0035F1FA74